jgi:hypothetical protein
MPMISEATPEVQVIAGGLRRRAPIPADLEVVCLWSALGLLLSMLVLASAFGAEIGQALAMAG